MLVRLLASLALTLLLATGAAARPLVVILADPRGAVATDLLAPYAILSDSGAVDVKVASPTSAPVKLTPGKAWAAPQMTFDELARAYPQGPDAVIVPALSVEDDPDRAAWLQAQLRSGARIMSICNGAKALASAGLLEGRQATIHWYSLGRMKKRYPDIAWRHDQRWVTDGPITTTAGISAAEPAALHLLGELAGQDVMLATAQRLGLPAPDQRHRGEDYRLTLKGALTVMANRLAFWRREKVAVPLTPGMDELAFGEAIDAWSRTYLSTAWASGPARVTTRHGLLIYRSRDLPEHFDRTVDLPRRAAVETTFEQIGEAYGDRTGRFVALQFEHPYGAVTAW